MHKTLTALAITSLLLSTGCSNNTRVASNEQVQLNNPNKAYVVFMREDTIVGGAHTPDIYSFTTNNFLPTHIASLRPGEKIAWEIDEGQHHFYINYFVEGISTIDAKKGQTYYVNINEHANNPRLDQPRQALESKLSLMSCSAKNLNQYLFTEMAAASSEGDSPAQTQSSADIKTYRSPALLGQQWAECRDDKISVLPLGGQPSIDELKRETTYIKPTNNLNNSTDSVRQKIQSFYPEWQQKYQGIPLTDHAFLKVIQPVVEQDYHSFSGIKVQPAVTELTDKEHLAEFNEKYHSLTKNGKRPLTVQTKILKYTAGNQLARYAWVPFVSSPLANSGAIHLQVDFIDDQGKLISRIEVSEHLIGGVFGRFNTLVNSTFDVVDEYIKRNLTS